MIVGDGRSDVPRTNENQCEYNGTSQASSHTLEKEI